MVSSDTDSAASWQDYHSVMRCLDGRDPVLDAIGQLGDWLRERKIDIDLAHDNDFSDEQRDFRIRYHQRDHGHDVLAELLERKEDGDYRSTLLASAQGWVEVTVSNSEGEFVAVPRLAKYLMQALHLGDSGLEFVDHPQVWGPDDSDRLMTLLANPVRRAPVFVAAGGDDVGLFDAFTRKTALWARETYGLAQVVVLRPDALGAVNLLLGTHALNPWTVRTFLPGVELGDPRDALRHRYLTPGTLGRWPDRRLVALLGGIARSLASEASTPPDVLKVHRDFRRLADSELVESLAGAEAAVDEVLQTSKQETLGPLPRNIDTNVDALAAQFEAYLERLDQARAVLGVDPLAPESWEELAARRRLDDSALARMRRRLEELQAEVERLEDENKRVLAVNEELTLDLGIADTEATNAMAETRWLRAKLRDAGQYDDSVAIAPLITAPETVTDLVEPLKDPAGLIVFTGSDKDVEEVALRDFGPCARTAWEAVEAMRDYLRAVGAGDFSGSFHDYVQRTPNGYRGFSPSKSAQNETGRTQIQFGGSRRFPVPREVDTSGAVDMNPHIKLGRIGMASPRMHYYHHAAGGRIYIGYLGLHLGNTMTN